MNKMTLTAACLLLAVASAHADDIEVQAVRTYAPGPDELGLISDDRTGGFILHGITKLDQQSRRYWIRRWKEDFSRDWLTTVESEYPTRAIDFFTPTNNGYLLGTRHITQDEKTLAAEHPDENRVQISMRASRSFIERISRLDDQGHTQSTISLALLGNSIQCATEVPEGFVVSGWKYVRIDDILSTEGPVERTVPWILRTDSTGKVLWEYTFRGDDKVLLGFAWDVAKRSCDRQLVPTGNGEVVAVFNGYAEAVGKTREGRRSLEPVKSSRATPARGNVVVRLDPHGKELARWTTPGTANESYLFSIGDRYVLIENYEPDIPEWLRNRVANPVTPLDLYAALGAARLALAANPAGVRYVELDADLKLIREVRSPAADAGEALRGVVPDGRGGYYIAGCGVASGVSVGHIDTQGRLGSLQKVNPRSMISCRAAGLVSTTKAGGAAVFVDNLDDLFGSPTTYTVYAVKRRDTDKRPD